MQDDYISGCSQYFSASYEYFFFTGSMINILIFIK